MTSPRPAPAGSDRWEIFFPLILVAAGLAAYHNSFAGTFVFDDDSAIAKDAELATGRVPWQAIVFAPRPLVKVSLLLNHEWGGFEPLGYHVVNVGVHLLAGLVLYGLVRRTLLLPRFGGAFSSSAAWLALAVALLWIVHPLQTESVTYLIQRAQAMGGLFVLLTLYCVLRGATASGGGRWWYVAAVTACTLGMLSKEDAVVAPVAALIYDRIFLAGNWRDVVRWRWGLHLGLIATWMILARSFLFALGVTPAGMSHASAGFALKAVTPWEYTRTQPQVILHYLGLSVWPSPLCLDYAWPPAETAAEILVPGLVLLALLGTTGWAIYRWPALGFVAAWFFLTLGPTSSFLPIADLAVEHRMYLPLAAVVLLAVLAGNAGLAWLGSRLCVSEGARRVLGGMAVGSVALALIAATVRRNEDYYSGVTIWQSVLAERPENPRAHYNLALNAFLVGDDLEVIKQCKALIIINPEDAKAHSLLGRALARTGRPDLGLQHLYRSIEIDPDDPILGCALGRVLLGESKLDEAEARFRKVLSTTPKYFEALNGLGQVIAQKGREEEALGYFEQAVQERPDYADVHTSMAITYRRLKRYEEAIRHHEEAARLKPRSDEVYSQTGLTLLCCGRPRDAVDFFRRAVALAPQRARFHRELGQALYESGDKEAAQAEYRESFRLAPDWVGPTNKIAWSMATNGRPRDKEMAVLLAKQVCQATAFGDPQCLDTLAAAQAAAKHFGPAVTTAREALKIAESRQPQLASAIRGRLALYEKGQPFLE